jgi:hypothetical protein
MHAQGVFQIAKESFTNQKWDSAAAMAAVASNILSIQLSTPAIACWGSPIQLGGARHAAETLH